MRGDDGASPASRVARRLPARRLCSCRIWLAAPRAPARWQADCTSTGEERREEDMKREAKAGRARGRRPEGATDLQPAPHGERKLPELAESDAAEARESFER